MTVEEMKQYILAHYEEQTNEEMAVACRKTHSRIRQLAYELGIKAITLIQRRINIIKAANGEKTTTELAVMIGCTREWAWYLCQKYKLPYKEWTIEEYPAPPRKRQENIPCDSIEEDREDEDVSQLPQDKRKEELEKYIQPYLAKGYSRHQAIELLAKVADWLINIPNPERLPKERSKGIYSNLTREQQIDQLLNS